MGGASVLPILMLNSQRIPLLGDYLLKHTQQGPFWGPSSAAQWWQGRAVKT